MPQIVEDDYLDVDVSDFLSDLDDILAEEMVAEGEKNEIFVEDADIDLIALVNNEINHEKELESVYSNQIPESPELNLVGLGVENGRAKATVTKAKKQSTVGEEPTSVKIKNKLGDDFYKLTMLEESWSSMSPAIHDSTIQSLVDGMAVYVSNKTINLFSHLNGGALNGVTSKAFDLLTSDGVLTGGDEGNLIRALLDKPYSLGTARSQGNQVMQMFTALKIGIRESRGSISANPESLILKRIKEMRGS